MMKAYFLLFGLLAALLAGCAQEPQDAGQTPQAQPPAPGSPPAGTQPPAAGEGAEAEFNECINDICGPGEDNLTRICVVSCWDDYAVATKDADKCDKNIQMLNSSIGYGVCIGAVSKAAADPAPCARLKTEFDRDLCYGELAEYLDDPKICDYVKDEDVMLTKQDCLNAVSGG